MLREAVSYLRNTSIQKYASALVSLIGLAASIIQLYTFFAAVSTPQTGSNFYVNSREFLAWTLIAWVYLFGLGNALLRRRWRKKYGDERANNSVANFFSWLLSLVDSSQEYVLRGNNFKRDFSIVYTLNFIFIFLYSRAVTATETGTGITASPWGDLWASLGLTLLFTIPLMIVTSAFDYTLSIVWGD